MGRTRSFDHGGLGTNGAGQRHFEILGRILPVASMFVIKGRDQGKRFDLTTVVASVGRDASNTIQLHDTEISRRHAEIRQEGEPPVQLFHGAQRSCDSVSAAGTSRGGDQACCFMLPGTQGPSRPQLHPLVS